MRPKPVRVVYDNRPYLVLRRDDGALDMAHGPFAPGTEPSLQECGPDNEVRDPQLLASLESLLPISPDLPPWDDTLAGSR
jgi:hypothetical protein